MWATAPVDLGPLLADLHTAQAAVSLIVDLLALAHIPGSDAARLVLAIRRSAREGRQIVVMAGDPHFQAVPALLEIPGLVVCATLDEAEQVIT